MVARPHRTPPQQAHPPQATAQAGTSAVPVPQMSGMEVAPGFGWFVGFCCVSTGLICAALCLRRKPLGETHRAPMFDTTKIRSLW